jgi:hypothetical protein
MTAMRTSQVKLTYCVVPSNALCLLIFKRYETGVNVIVIKMQEVDVCGPYWQWRERREEGYISVTFYLLRLQNL